jgi:hypothetical protein
MSTGYISLERSSDDELGMLPGDRNRILALVRLAGWRDSQAAYELLFAGDGVSDDAGVLTTEQACRLADALEATLDDIPDYDARRHKLRPCPWAGPQAAEQGWLEEDPQRPLSPLEYWSGQEKDLVRELAAFCRRGSFRVVWQSW